MGFLWAQSLRRRFSLKISALAAGTLEIYSRPPIAPAASFFFQALKRHTSPANAGSGNVFSTSAKECNQTLIKAPTSFLMALPMESILEELRAVDGELFKSEQTQRLYLLLKTQAAESMRSVWQVSKDRKLDTYSKALKLYAVWGPNLKEEEMRRLRLHRGVDELWLQVAMLYVKLSHRATEVKTVKIKTPLLDDLVQNFFTALAKSPFTQSGELWTYDAVRQDYAMRELFRVAVMNSVTFLESAPEPKVVLAAPTAAHAAAGAAGAAAAAAASSSVVDDDVYPEDSISSFLDARETKARRPEGREYIRDEHETLDKREEDKDEKLQLSSSSTGRHYVSEHDEFEREVSDDEEDDKNTRVGPREVRFRDGGRNDDGATVVIRHDVFDDSKTVTRPSFRGETTAAARGDAATVIQSLRARNDDAGSTISGSTRSSGSSRFGRINPARVLTLGNAPQLGAIEEVRHVRAEVDEDDEEDEEEKPISVRLPSSMGS